MFGLEDPQHCASIKSIQTEPLNPPAAGGLTVLGARSFPFEYVLFKFLFHSLFFEQTRTRFEISFSPTASPPARSYRGLGLCILRVFLVSLASSSRQQARFTPPEGLNLASL